MADLSNIDKLLENNRAWAQSVARDDPDFFKRIAQGQQPEVLWIGCSDSRVPESRVAAFAPGEAFVHRNIANVVAATDLNCLSVLEYAVAVLKVRKVIVCGHYRCGGVAAAMGAASVGLIDNWLRNIRAVREKHSAELAKVVGEENRLARLCELNVVEQVQNVAATSIVQQAWAAGQELAVHGLIFDIETGLLKDLDTVVGTPGDVCEEFRLAMD